MLDRKSDAVMFECSPCPNGCAASDESVLQVGDRLHGIAGNYYVVRCRQCTLQRTNPRPTPAAMGQFYPEEYSPHQVRRMAEPAPSKLRSIFLRILEAKTRKLPLSPPGRLLELGCASGDYLLHAIELGWQVNGIEPSENAGLSARAKGLNVQISTVENAQPPIERYDVIAAWMVLEHLHEPVECLLKIRDWVLPNGYLVILVPDAKSLAKRLFHERCYDLQLPTHLFHYTPETIAIVLRNSGWQIERIVWQRSCITLLRSAEYWAEDYQQYTIVAFLRWVRLSAWALPIRSIFGWVLGITRSSGRMEVWARPENAKDGAS